MDLGVYLQYQYIAVVASLICFIFWAGYWCVHILAICYGLYKLNRKVQPDEELLDMPGVSIIKPLVGTDPNLASNLATFFTLNYPKYEVLFCVHNECDPALAVVKSLMAKFPSTDAHVFIGGCNVGVNPKINNMMPAYLDSKYDLILISDSNIRMKVDTLLDMVMAMKNDVGLVSQLPFTCDREGFACTLEKVYFGTAQARIYLLAHALGLICCTGMSSMLRKQIVDELGGLQSFGVYLAEDYFMARAIHSQGWKVTISSQPAWQNSGATSVASFHERLCRWAKLRLTMVPVVFILEPFQECMLLGILASYAVSTLFQWNSVMFFIFHVIAWMCLDYTLLRIIQGCPLPCKKLELFICWLCRELMAPSILGRALWSSNFAWKSGSFRLNWGGVAEVIKM